MTPLPISAFFNHSNAHTDISILFIIDTDIKNFDTDTRYQFFLLVSIGIWYRYKYLVSGGTLAWSQDRLSQERSNQVSSNQIKLN